MAASAEHNEIIELTDLIEKGPDLPKNSPKTPEPLPCPTRPRHRLPRPLTTCSCCLSRITGPSPPPRPPRGRAPRPGLGSPS